MKTKSFLPGTVQMPRICRLLLLHFCAMFVLSCSYPGTEAECLFQYDRQNNRVTYGDISTYLKVYKNIDGLTKDSDFVNIEPVLNGPDTVMYIVNYEDGWEVLSSDKRAPVVLMSCESGHATTDMLYSNPAQAEFVDGIKYAISGLMDDPSALVVSQSDNWGNIMPLEEKYDTWTPWRFVGSHIDSICRLDYQDHLLKTHWGQAEAWNIKAPYTDSSKTKHCPTGCVMVAGSQVLYYLHYRYGIPENVYGNCICDAYIQEGNGYVCLNSSNCRFPEESFGNSYWDLMPLSKDDSASISEFGYVSSLMSWLGYLINANYGKEATGAYTFNLSNIFRVNFSVDNMVTYDYDIELIRNQISKEKLPCIFSIGKSNGTGHAVVIDGCKYERIHKMMEYVKNNNLGNICRKSEQVVTYNNYVAINWGWEGNADYDQTTKATIWYNAESIKWRDYTEFRYMIYGFRPVQ